MKTQVSTMYQQLKDMYPGCVLFFRMEKSYETYFEDAKVCSRICGLNIENREKENGLIPLVNILVHALEGCLKMMLQTGRKVAVFELIGPDKRDCVRLLIPCPD